MKKYCSLLFIICLTIISGCSSIKTDKLDNIYLGHMSEKGYLENDFSRLYGGANSVSVKFYDSSTASTNLEIKNFFNETINYTGINIYNDRNKLILQNTTNVGGKIYVLSGFIDNNNHLFIESFLTGTNENVFGFDYTFVLSGSVLVEPIQDVLQKNFYCEHIWKNIETDEILNTYTGSIYLGIENGYITLTENYRMTVEGEVIESNDIKTKMIVKNHEDSKIILHQLGMLGTGNKEFHIVSYDENLQTITMEKSVITDFIIFSKCALLD